ncbi:O-linked N-acetylglucosamine transferase, SPINDLY family protein [Kamptonema sp. UHCC 0994]|uniref:O-linked N-acetylglucosamine transferase, SPINDLY family protein n=1 Tax=Kamptonema sp. UHCC 0994 TaxID=3031329 RepID=UPI0023B92377|nr:O-linked N-acetylglucosamine transferase, SPINDLY family protein [Kamptonema sp. UHCC 0994]MDF0555265.1 O-linked N-acetylglucosamine transferase, SPINDLY family protein [Kamptonema sp. UHCC 0994]
MNTEYPPTEYSYWQQQAHQYLLQGDFYKAANLYEKAIQAEPDTKSHYWHLGLMLLLQEEETEAQTTWLLGMAEGEPEQVDLWTVELIKVLQTEAERRGEIGDYLPAWAIRQHIREINPADINNLLHLIGLSILLETYTGEELTDLGVIEMLGSEPPIEVDFDLLMQLLKNVLAYAPLQPSSLELAETCIKYVHDPLVFLELVIAAAVEIGYILRVPQIGISLLEVCRRLDVEKYGKTLNQLAILPHLASFHQNLGQYDEGIKIAKLCYSLSEDLADKAFANHKVLRGLMSAGGYWEEVDSFMEEHESVLELLVKEPLPLATHPAKVQNLFSSTFFFPYFEDRADNNRRIHNQVAQLCQVYIQNKEKEQVERYRDGHLSRKSQEVAGKRLKIGYISHCLLRHSVGWLARWLFQCHDREQFEIYGYFVGYRKTSEPLQEWYVEKVDKAYKAGFSYQEIAEQIYQDEIDILIDLDSITLDVTCAVMALKPAPIQVTWLGWDASGMPAIDYFLADPYVLPESAQDYYNEKIWRLPDTYIAVGGFELGLPTLRRDQLDIPIDAVVYLSSQKSYKRHPRTVRLQMKILKEVPNSYFLIKGSGDEESIKNFFNQLAEEEGVGRDRLRFLPEASQEHVHRANLDVADVVLDTYPYNGATTTLETLWMCIPLVTRVGQQFAARNSYTMMMNVGVTEGIAWTDEEYVEWGIRLGKDAALRQQISWKLRQSRQTSPLWNAEKFTREMENAYEQMWQIYVDQSNS